MSAQKKPRIFRHSWWESAQEKRKFVVVGIYYDVKTQEAQNLEILEFGKPQSYRVPYATWIEQIADQKLIQIA